MGTSFNRDEMAKWYAKNHLRTDAGIREVYYLPSDSPDREIRFVEVNELLAERAQDPIEPIDFGVDTDKTNGHKLLVLDITPSQWEKINKKELSLPANWNLNGAIPFPRGQ